MVSANREMAVYCFDTLVAHYNSQDAPPPAFDEGQQYNLSLIASLSLSLFLLLSASILSLHSVCRCILFCLFIIQLDETELIGL